jgi:hypothetical protein
VTLVASGLDRREGVVQFGKASDDMSSSSI